MPKSNLTKQNIIKNATISFLEKGLNDVTIEEIAIKSGISRRTIYRYISSKEDLIFEVAINLFETWNKYQLLVFEEASGNAYEKLKHYFDNIIKYFYQEKDFVAFAGEFDFYFKDNKKYNISKEVKEKFDNIIHVSESIITEIFIEGIKDNSINLNHDLDITVLTISNVLWSFAQRIAIRGNMLETEFDIDIKKLVNCQLELYYKVFKK